MTTDEGTGAKLFVQALEEYNIQYVFGNPGTTELPIINAVAESDHCEYVMALHEDIAVGMAAGYAKNRVYQAHHDEDIVPVGVANLHAAPGMAHGLGNLHGSHFSGAPVLITGGIQSTDFQHEEPILSGDMVEMTEQFTKWSAEVKDVSALPEMVRRAVRTALTPPTGPVFLGLPLNITQAETSLTPTSLGSIPNAGSGDSSQVKQAVSLLSSASDPVMVVGDQVARSGPRAIQAAVDLAEKYGATVYGEILAAEVSFPTDHDQWAGFIPPKEELAAEMMDTDTLVFVGCSTNTTITRYNTALVSDQSTCIHITNDAWELGKNSPADAAILGDPGLVMEQVIAELAEGTGRSLDRSSDTPSPSDEARGDSNNASTDSNITKERLTTAIQNVAPDARIVDESVTTKYVFLEHATLEPEQFLSTKGGGLGHGLPAAVGVAIAEQHRENEKPIIGLIGDGSYFYYPQAIYTAARYGVNLTIVVPNNRSYAVLKANTTDLLGGEGDTYAFDEMGIDLPTLLDIPTSAEGVGVESYSVTESEQLEATLRTAIETTAPTVVDVHVPE